MKLKKDSVRNSILKASRDEFFLHGYKDASIREIAKNANITPGNIYRYYDSKEKLFDAVVGEVNDSIMKIISLEGMTLPKIITESTKVIEFIISKAVNLVIKDKYEVVIILSKAQDSKYESTYENIVEYTAKSIDETSKNSNYDLSRIISQALIGSVLTIVQENIDDDEKIRELIFEFVYVLFANKGIKRA